MLSFILTGILCIAAYYVVFMTGVMVLGAIIKVTSNKRR